MSTKTVGRFKPASRAVQLLKPTSRLERLLRTAIWIWLSLMLPFSSRIANGQIFRQATWHQADQDPRTWWVMSRQHVVTNSLGGIYVGFSHYGTSLLINGNDIGNGGYSSSTLASLNPDFSVRWATNTFNWPPVPPLLGQELTGIFSLPNGDVIVIGYYYSVEHHNEWWWNSYSPVFERRNSEGALIGTWPQSARESFERSGAGASGITGGVMSESGESLYITTWRSSNREYPTAPPPTYVEVSFDGKILRRFESSADFPVQHPQTPPWLAKLKSDTWNITICPSGSENVYFGVVVSRINGPGAKLGWHLLSAPGESAIHFLKFNPKPFETPLSLRHAKVGQNLVLSHPGVPGLEIQASTHELREWFPWTGATQTNAAGQVEAIVDASLGSANFRLKTAR